MKIPKQVNTHRVRNTTDKSFYIWIMVESAVIIAAAFLSFLFVEYAARSHWFAKSANDNILLHALGIIVPMSVILGALNHFLSRWTYRYVVLLVNGIGRIANGEFETQLDLRDAGPFLPVYVNFNKMATELKNMQTLRNDFINTFSHEFKTPITSINGFAALLIDTKVSDEEKEQYLKIIFDESAYLAKMADSAILLTKLNAQQIVPDREPFYLDEQLRLCVILLSNEWSRKKINVTGSLDSVVFFGNKELMDHLWINLLSNAIKFTPENGEISISVSETRKKITVQISDTGIGMNEEEISHIFDQYYQGKMAFSGQGLGLGLSIAKRIVDLYNGIIDVQSVENVGSTFTVILPK
jgi:signal transduction histidine kinase